MHTSSTRIALRTARRLLAVVAIALGLVSLGAPAPVRAAEGDVHVLRVDGIINPISARYVERGIDEAEEEGAAAVLIEIDTPGGLLDATQDLTSAMLSAEVPIITYVTPPGTHAASAGVFITMAGHVAAMAPSTRIGAATPVSGDASEIPEDLLRKLVNDTVQYARDIAEARGRNADWAEDAVRDAVVVGANEAVELEVVDLVAVTREELLREVDGTTVAVRSGDVVLVTAGAGIVERDLSPWEDFLMVLSNPNLAVILLSLGTLGIYFELSNPGAFFPGIAGAIALILALFSLGTLPINYAGLALLVLGLALMGSEIWVQSGGVLGIGGAISFLLGGLLLIDDTQAPFLEVSRPLIIGLTAVLVGFTLFAFRAVLRTRQKPVFISGSDMVGLQAVAHASGTVFVEGERWRARRSDGQPLVEGEPVRVTAREGFELVVEPLDRAAEHHEAKET